MKTLNILLLLLLCVISHAQIQQGYVKTPTRRNANGVMTKGDYLPNATIEINMSGDSQSHVSTEEGRFSFSAPKTFYVTGVSAKKGQYTFLDADFSLKHHQYSKNDLEILVDDPKVLVKVKQETQARERRRLSAQIHAMQIKIDSLRDAEVISLEEYNLKMDSLEEYRNNSEQLVRRIVEVYASFDWDRLGDFNSQLLAFVEDGDYLHADSLLSTQKSKEVIFNEIKEKEAANNSQREKIKKEQEELSISDDGLKKEKDIYSQRLLIECQKFLGQPLMQDSALYCLKLRADVDTTNLTAVWDYAHLCEEQRKYDESLKYYKICINNICKQNDSIPVHLYSTLANIHSNIGKIYIEQKKNFELAEEELKKSLKIRQQSLKVNNYRSDKFNLVRTLTNLGAMYLLQKRYDLSKEFYKEAINVSRSFSIQDEEEQLSLVGALNGLAQVCFMLNQIENYEALLQEALEVSRELFNTNPSKYSDKYILSLSNLGFKYSTQNKKELAERLCNESLQLAKGLIKQNPDRHNIVYAYAQYMAGCSYYNIGRKELAEQELDNALQMYRKLDQINHDSYNLELTTCLHLLGQICKNKDNSELAEKYLLEEFEICRRLQDCNSDKYNLDIANSAISGNLELLYGESSVSGLFSVCQGDRYKEENNYELAEKKYLQAIEFFKQQETDAFSESSIVAEVTNYWHAMAFQHLGALYNDIEQYELAEINYQKSLDLYNELSEKHSVPHLLEVVEIYNNLGGIKGKSKKWQEALKYLLKANDICKQLAEKEPEYFNYFLSLSFDLIGATYIEQEKYQEAECYYIKALDIINQLAEKDPDQYNSDLARIYYHLGKIYREFEDVSKCIENMYSAYVIFEKLYQNNPEEYADDLSASLGILSVAYLVNKDYKSAEKYYFKTLDIYKKISEQTQDSISAGLAYTYLCLMDLYKEIKNIEQYEIYLDKALVQYNKLYFVDPAKYKKDIVYLQYETINRLLYNGKDKEALDLAKETLRMDEASLDPKSYIANLLNTIACTYANEHKFTEAIEYIDKAITLDPNEPDYYDSKGEILLMQGKNEEALAMWRKVLEINSNFLEDYPDGTNLSNGLKKLGLIE